MGKELRFLIIDGYPKPSRDVFDRVGMKHAWLLFADMLVQNLPEATYDVLLPSDEGVEMPSAEEAEKYAGILWTGCNLSINDIENPAVSGQIELAKTAFEIGVPGFGSCWGIQMAAVAAGGKVEPNPKGREMGMGRKIHLTEEGKKHPMYEGKNEVFEGFVSHDDMVTEIPEGGVWLAGNSFARVQGLAVTHKKGTFWATQYHCEYNLYEVARLIVAREEKLTRLGFFKGHEDMVDMVNKMEALAAEPDRKDLRWQLAIDDDLLDDSIRQCEFVNWLKKIVLPRVS